MYSFGLCFIAYMKKFDLLCEKRRVLMNWKKGLTLLIAVGIAAGVLAGCGSDSGSDKKVITFGAETTYPPFEFAEDNTYKGFDVDLSKALAKEMGYESKFVSLPFDGLIPALQSKQIDAIASGLVVTKEREAKVNFTEPYYHVKLVMVVRQDTNNVNGEADIVGKTVGAQIGTTGAMLAQEKPGTTVKEFDAITTMLQDLQAGNIQIAMLDEPVAKYYIQKLNMNDLKIVPIGLQDHTVAIAVRKDDKELLDKMNAAFEKLKANGEYDKLQQKWFGDIQ